VNTETALNTLSTATEWAFIGVAWLLFVICVGAVLLLAWMGLRWICRAGWKDFTGG